MDVVYCSRTGYTREYAQLLGRGERLRVYSLEEAKNQLEPGAQVFFLGPLMAGTVTGLKEARKRFAVLGACGVGMSPASPQVLEALARRNGTGELPLFYLQGGWDPDRVGWFKRHGVQWVTRSLRRQLEEKGEGRTPEEQVQLEFLIRGGSFVRPEKLQPIRDWLAARGEPAGAAP